MLSTILPTDRLPHGWQVIAVLLGVASVFTLCWYLSEQGLLDLAATALSFFILTLIRLLGPSLESKAPREFKRSAALFDQLRRDYAHWMTERRLSSQMVIAFVMTVCFLVGRFIASTVLTAIASPWLALALGLMLAAAVASPVLVRGLMDTVKSGAPRKPTQDEATTTADDPA